MTAPTFARGVSKTVAMGIETAFGTASAAAGQLLRRTSSDLNLTVQEIQSAEILQSQQVRDNRQGPRQVQGSVAGQLSPGTYRMFMEGLLRNTFAAPTVATVNLTDSTALVDTNGNLVVHSPSTTWSNDYRIGDVVRITGLTGGSAVDNAQNMRVVSFSANDVVLGPPAAVAAFTSGQTDVFTFPGKKLLIPATGQLDSSYTIEHYYADIARSELFTGCKVTGLTLNVPASGFCTMQASVTGQQMVESGNKFFTNPTAPSTTTGLTATFGEINYGQVSAPSGYITGFNLQMQAQVGADPVVGSNLVPQIFPGTMSVRGSLTALMTNDTMTSDFLAENEVAIGLLLTASPAPGADFISIYLPRVKLTSSTKTDSDRAITRSYNFVALENTLTSPNSSSGLSSVIIQDSSL